MNTEIKEMNGHKTKKWLLCVVAAHLLSSFASSASAQALTTTVTGGPFSSVAGAVTVDFGNSPVNDSGPVAGNGANSVLLSGTLGGVQYTYTGGALFNTDNSNLGTTGISARPVGSTGNYWSIGNSPVAQQGPGVITFASAVTYFGFLWGSPDSYNHVSFFDGTTQLGTFDGSAVLNPPNGNQSVAQYFNVFAGQGQVITKIVFDSATSNAFETDNHAFIAAVPEPETYAMMLSGLGLMGFVARRRKRVPELA